MFGTSSSNRAFAALGTTAAILAASGGLAFGATPDSAQPGAAMDVAVATYQKVFPQMSPDAARTAAAGEEERKRIVEELTRANAGTYGGAWFDPPSGVLHVAATSALTQAKAQELGRDLGVAVQTHSAKRTLAQLQARADAVRNGDTSLSRSAKGVGIDVQRNAVVAAVPESRRAAVRSYDVPQGVTVVSDPRVQAEEDAGCTSRAACDWTIRAGSVLWRTNTSTPWCSVGFTARTSTNVRYTYSAGHCSTGNGVTWGTGGLSIGPMEASMNSGVVDAARIRVTNGWFTGDTGGDIYMDSASGKRVDLNGVAPSVSYMVQGERVCLAANITQPNGPNYCGVIGAVSDWTVRGMTRVDGVDACNGDSGGGWYWLTSTGRRIAYGLHSRSDTGCHGSQSGSRSWYTPIAEAKRLFSPGLNVEVRP